MLENLNHPVVTGICNPNKYRARHHRSLKLGSKLKTRYILTVFASSLFPFLQIYSYQSIVIGLKYFSNSKGILLTYRTLFFVYCLIVYFSRFYVSNGSSLYIAKKQILKVLEKLYFLSSNLGDFKWFQVIHKNT